MVHLAKAKFSAERLLGVLNDNLAISKSEAEHIVFESAPLHISVVIENVTSAFIDKYGGTGLGLAISKRLLELMGGGFMVNMRMPVMSGEEVTQAFRADLLNQAAPILAMTTNAFDRDCASVWQPG